MNSTYYETLDKNFNEAIKLCEREFEHNELIEMLRNGNLPQKQIAALKLTTVKSANEAQILVSNLTGQDGKIRETVSLKLEELMNRSDTIEFFQNPQNYKVFKNAVVDINANICRNVISAITNLKNNDEFCKYFSSAIADMIFELLPKIENFNEQDGKYTVNKELFKLYWCLECVFEFFDNYDISTLKSILKRTKLIAEYTIREKTAKILTRNYDDSELLRIKSELRQDKNYYVKRF